MRKKHLVPVMAVILIALEAAFAYAQFAQLEPFPYNEFYFKIVDHVLRDALLCWAAWGLYFRRSRIKDRVQRYFPVVVVGVMYLGVAFFMINQLSLDLGFLTTLSVLAGINNNIFLLLLTAICYHKWPNLLMKIVYFLMYFYTALSLVFDAFYFWQTSMHVESVLFQNLNIYAVQGIFATMSTAMIAGIAAAVAAILLLFRVTKPAKHKPNFAWSLLCVAMFSMGLNLADRVLGTAGIYCFENVIGMYAEVEIEKTRQTYRNMVAMPININFANKALFDTDKIATASHIELRELTDKDLRTLQELGIFLPRVHSAPVAPAYDKVVLLVLESVHRDYINYYNSSIPEEATPFLNSLIIKYPHLDRYYSSSVPTTQGLNATFRSHLIMDKDIPGDGTPSLFRSVQEKGMRGIFMNASSQYYANELREYPDQFGMQEYYAKEYLEKQGYTGASGWGFHNDVMYDATLKLLEEGKNDRMLLVTKTLDMHQPYPYTGISWNDNPEPVRNQPYATIRGMYWVDSTLKHFFEEAERRGLMDDRTLFVITSDHNPHSGGEYTKIVTNAADKQSIAPIPLIFVSKNLAPLDTLRTGQYASQIDLAPTLLYLLGIEVPELFMGRNLLEYVNTPYALGYFGGKAYYWSDEMHFVDQMDKPVPDSDYEDALSNYIVHEYTKWHQN